MDKVESSVLKFYEIKNYYLGISYIILKSITNIRFLLTEPKIIESNSVILYIPEIIIQSNV